MSSAAETKFCSTSLTFDRHKIYVDGNSKITGDNGDFENPMPNAFSLVQVEDCPFSTPTCRASCYVHHLEKHAKTTHDMYRHNSKTIRQILGEVEPMRVGSTLVYTLTEYATSWAKAFGGWISQRAQHGFRWHVSGDVYSRAYARWLVEVCKHSPDVPHWIYTRSFRYVETLIQAENLTVNLSADWDNFHEAVKTAVDAIRFHDRELRICFLSSDGGVPELSEGDVIFPDYKFRQDEAWFNALEAHQRKMICPVDFFGKSRTIRCGPSNCRKCLKQP